jgi:hypothetical protein
VPRASPIRAPLVVGGRQVPAHDDHGAGDRLRRVLREDRHRHTHLGGRHGAERERELARLVPPGLAGEHRPPRVIARVRGGDHVDLGPVQPRGVGERLGAEHAAAPALATLVAHLHDAPGQGARHRQAPGGGGAP